MAGFLRSARRLLRLPRGCVAGLALAAALPSPVSGEPAPRASDPVLDRVERHAVVVSVRFRKDVEADAEGTSRLEPDSTPEVFRRWRMSLRVPGFVVRDRRTVLASDLFVPRGSVHSIEVEGRSGARVAATLSAFLPRCGAVVLTAAADLDVEPLSFPDGTGLDLKTRAFVGSVGEGLRGDETWAEALGSSRRRSFPGEGLSYGSPERATAGLGGSRLSRTADLVVLEDGTALGFRFGSSVDLEESVWTGPDVLGDLSRAVPFASLAAAGARLRDARRLLAVRLAYRAEPDAGEEDAAPFSFGSAADTPGPDDHRVHYGLVVSADRVLVPATLSDAWVRRIESASVERPDGTAARARFEGRVRGLGAFVVRLDEPLSPAPDAAACPRAPGAEEGFLVHRVAFRAGARRDRTDYNRSLGRTRGYGDERLLASEQAVDAGSFLLDREGNAFGVACDLLPEDVDAEVPAAGRPPRSQTSRGVVAAVFADRGGAVVLAEDLDRRVTPSPPGGAPRLPWLGVEHEGIDRAVAEALGVAGPTLDGARGRIVTYVHAGSPAARAGLAEGDVLLTARRTETPGGEAPPVDLRDEEASDFGDDGSEVPRLWAPRLDGLVRLLDSWGVGRTYEIAVARGSETRTVPLVVERAPRDWTSAERARDAGVGLTVREATYEVRHALRLPADAAGIVVSRVDEGSPAAQARIQPNEVLREMDGRALASPADFAALLAAARSAGRPSVRVVVLRLARTRFVDLALAAAPTDGAAAAKGD